MARRTRERRGSGSTREDVPYVMRLPDGRSMFFLLPSGWCETDVSGVPAFGPQAVRFLDRVRVLAMRMPKSPTPGFILTMRQALGLTQTELGKRIGVDKMTVSRWERGSVSPSLAAVKSLDRLRRGAARRGIEIAA